MSNIWLTVNYRNCYTNRKKEEIWPKHTVLITGAYSLTLIREH